MRVLAEVSLPGAILRTAEKKRGFEEDIQDAVAHHMDCRDDKGVPINLIAADVVVILTEYPPLNVKSDDVSFFVKIMGEDYSDRLSTIQKRVTILARDIRRFVRDLNEPLSTVEQTVTKDNPRVQRVWVEFNPCPARYSASA